MRWLLFIVVGALVLSTGLLFRQVEFQHEKLARVCAAVSDQNHAAIMRKRGLIDMINDDDLTAIDPAYRPIFDAGCQTE